MHQGKLVFSHLMTFLPLTIFRRCIAAHREELGFYLPGSVLCDAFEFHFRVPFLILENEETRRIICATSSLFH